MATSETPTDDSQEIEIDCLNRQAARMLRERFPEYVAETHDERRLTTVTVTEMPDDLFEAVRSIATSRRRAAVTYEDLSLFTGEDRETWAQRVWDTVDDRDYLFIRALGGRGDGSCTNSRLHLPAEFPDEDLEAEPNDEIDEACTACWNHQEVFSWKYKPVAVYPVDYRDVCNYCLREFATWWFFNEHSRGYDV